MTTFGLSVASLLKVRGGQGERVGRRGGEVLCQFAGKRTELLSTHVDMDRVHTCVVYRNPTLLLQRLLGLPLFLDGIIIVFCLCGFVKQLLSSIPLLFRTLSHARHGVLWTRMMIRLCTQGKHIWQELKILKQLYILII